ncbi:hypothetical protein L5470_01030 [Synechococcus sp. PCC 6717]|nr:hypothetical protein [Synechococcus sp. PCC 6717]
MLETCPRCSARLGPPLSTGRQVCSVCGWSCVVVERGTSSASTAQTKTGLVLLLAQLGRLIRRFFQYLILQVRLFWQGLGDRVRRQRQQPRQSFVERLANKLQRLETQIPTGDPRQEWLTPEEAFELLGGQLDNPHSKVSTLNGKRCIGLSAFRRLVNTAEYADFGFEYSSDRRLKNLPYLRRLPQ